MPEPAAQLSRNYGGIPGLHKASQLSVSKVRSTNLILTATREHRSAVVSLHPRASRTTFTVREFARLVEGFVESETDRWEELQGRGVGHLQTFVDEVSRLRGFSRTLPSALDDDIVDPYRRSREIYEVAGSLINDSVGVIGEAILRLLDAPEDGTHSIKPLSDSIHMGQRRSTQQPGGE